MEQIKELIQIEEQISELIKKKQELASKLVGSSPACFQNEDGTWTRCSITDHKLNIEEGFYKIIRIERYSTKIETLKHMPKELKEA